MIEQLYPYRFRLFLASQLLILFGALVFSSELHDNWIAPLLNIESLLAGLILLSKKKRVFGLVLLLLLLAIVFFISEVTGGTRSYRFNVFILGSFFLFHIIVTKELILQIWTAKKINEETILGLISGFISLGFVGFFICLITEVLVPATFILPENGVPVAQNLMYFSYVTLLTIGYGDILPANVLGQKIVVLIGLAGQMYLVVLTSIVIGKYISQKEIE